MTKIEKAMGGGLHASDKSTRFYSGDGHQYEKSVLDECSVEDPKYTEAAIKLKTDINPRFLQDLEKLNRLQGEDREKGAKRIIKFLLRGLEGKSHHAQDIFFQRALDLAKEHQPMGDEGKSVELNDPQKPFLAELRTEIQDHLGLKPEEYDRLKVFTTVGTDVDYLFGTDAVVEFGEKGDKDYRVITLDLTLRKEKMGKADIIIDREVKGVKNKEEEEEFWEVVEDTGRRVSKKILVG